mmetsp:Transcript_12365/g.49548  ORF Transcript_12365/g.49548 Transcript_12365/m.49548 type:complete len:190 (+) Transcript_12365:231-800(+)
MSYLPAKRKSSLQKGKAKKNKFDPYLGSEEEMVAKAVRVVMSADKVNIAQFPARFRERYGHVDIKETRYLKWRTLIDASNVLEVDRSNFIHCLPRAYKLYSLEDDDEGTADTSRSESVEDLLGSALESGTRGRPLFVADSKHKWSKPSVAFTASDSEEESDSDVEEDSADELCSFTPLPVNRRKAIEYF